MKTKAFTAQRWPFEVDGQKFVLVKGSSRYSKFYVCDEDGQYLTGRGHSDLQGAQVEAIHLARKVAS